MKQAVLDGRRIDSMEQVHAIMKSSLSFPDYYGNNLDALNDCLTDISEITNIIIVRKSKLLKNLGTKGEDLIDLLEHISQEHSNVHVQYRHWR